MLISNKNCIRFYKSILWKILKLKVKLKKKNKYIQCEPDKLALSINESNAMTKLNIQKTP